MATLLLEGVNDQVVTMYEHTSREVKQQFTKVIEEIIQLWTQRDQDLEDLGDAEALWQEVLEFGRHHPTFHLDWEHNKLTREEMNEG